jgi:hypothetical protein
MQLYGKIYIDGNNIHIQIIEGIYYISLIPKAREVGDIDISDNKFCKCVKQPYNVIHSEENALTLKKRLFDISTNTVSFEDKYFLLTQVLTEQGMTLDRITHILHNVNSICSNRNIKPYQSWREESQWINI